MMCAMQLHLLLCQLSLLPRNLLQLLLLLRLPSLQPSQQQLHRAQQLPSLQQRRLQHPLAAPQAAISSPHVRFSNTSVMCC